MKNTAGLLFFVLFWLACQKGELPPNVFDSPVFTVQFSTPGLDSGQTTAGLHDIYLFTDFTSNPDIIVCSGSFSKENCPAGNCPGSLGFEFKRAFTDVFQPDSVFHQGFYTFQNPDTTGGAFIFRTFFNVVPNSTYTSYSWKIDSQNVGAGAALVLDFPDELPRFVELTAQKPTGLRSIVKRTISLANPGFFYPAVGINVTKSGNGYMLEAETSGAPISDIAWNTGAAGDSIFQDSLTGAYAVTVTGAGSAASAELFNLVQSDAPLRTAGFTYDVEPLFIPATPDEVAIQWIDNAGIIWRSDWGKQGAGASFAVLESEPYEHNERQQQTRKMRVAFSCRLFNGSGQSRLFSGSGIIAVAHP